MKRRLKKLILLLGDVAVLYLALYLALLLRYQAQPSAQLWGLHFGPFTIAFVFWLVIFYISELYNINIAVNNGKFFKKTAQSVFIAAFLTVFFFYASPDISIAPKTNLLVYIAVFTMLFLGWRRAFNWALAEKFPKEKLAIIGYNRNVQELIDAIGEKPHLGFSIEMVATSRLKPGALGGINVVGSIGNLKQHIIRFRINTIVFAANPHQSPDLRKILFSCLPLNISFVSLPNFYESITGKVPLEAISQMWFLENLGESDKKWFDLAKRSYDLAIAGSILLLSAPFWPLIAALLKIENQEPVFFTQTRAGRNHRPFRMLKFRTQRSAGYDPSPSTKDDPRTTRFGRFLRRTRIDEIPQVINIIRGDMSFVGPRPERPELIEKLRSEIPFYDERALVKPGLTGWDQVSGEYHSPTKEDTLKKLQYDLYYVKNRSIYLDVSIILKTIATVLRRGGV